MKFEVTSSFRADRKRLAKWERDLVADALPAFVEACERYAADPASGWPDSLRVKDVDGAPGVCKVTFNSSGPDVRATFEWVQIDGEVAVRWRHVGGHRIFSKP